MIDFAANYRMLIDGELVKGEATLPVVNPATGQAFATAPDATAAQLDRAVAAANAAFPAWRALSPEERGGCLVRAADIIQAHLDELAVLFTREQGRPTAFAREEIAGAAYWLRASADLRLPIDVIEDTPERRIEVRHEPLGAVCGIVPWNFPIAQASWKIGPPLIAGNTVVIKPSPFTPLATLKMGELLRGVFPLGVLNIVSGGDALGPAMTAHPGFRKISFTGSTATGKRVMETAARDLKRVTLELGGNDPAIVLDDVDVDAIAEQIFFGAFYNSAQICAATKRLFVQDAVYDALRDRLHAMARGAKLGDGAEPGTMFGPIQNERQFARVRALLDAAERDGLAVLKGADAPAGGGFFVPLTIVDNPPDESRVVAEEAFGPILPMLRFHDVEEAIARANATSYGLTASIWTRDIARATEIAGRLECGTVWINQIFTLTPMSPAGGAKQSGIGVEGGLAGLIEFTQAKTVYIPKAGIPETAPPMRET
ncbi:aldehyde dehydrogenase family protein [Sphingomonas profundi]|uniref:aldehyde dehydrogenase family protein n=1 Tax=Alterirhizorhabdus profundi TaxID=2681549 RepID=UPI0012E82AAC|nr:aldehyde dehydrogenase family protein [Sphingomonas profundi]